MKDNFEHLSKEEFEDLRKIFYSQSYEIVEDLQDLVLKLEDGPENAETLKAVQRHFHTLKGDSTSIGLTELSTLCHRIEDVLTSLREKTRKIDHDTTALLFRSIDSIEKMLRTSESGTDAGDAGDAGKALKDIDAFMNREQEVIQQNTPSSGYTEYQMLQIEEALERGQKLFETDIVLHPMCAEKKVAGFMLLQRLQGAGEIISSTPALDSDEIDGFTKISIVFSSESDEASLKERLFIAGITEEVDVRSFVVIDRTNPGKNPGIKDQENQVSPDTEQKTPNSRSEMLRVEVSKVDWIINLVGELIIGRSIIEQIAKDAEEGESAATLAGKLFSVNSYMERTVSDLQKGMMKMRMVPVNHVFRRFPKIARELAIEKGKKILIEIYGRDKELDKGIVDALGEPLVHIIRNSIDHGIEDPLYRKEKGKIEEGLITLRAYHEASQIVIEVSDDGKGIDIEKLKAKALEKGFIAPEEIQRLSDREALNLIFLSGLSTSETISDISGRGIGMDAVKTSIENMKGTIEIDSSNGKGTKFTIRLPLTLAVIKVLMVEVNGKLYALPVTAIAEVLRITRDELVTVDGKETLMLREGVISILNIDEVFRAQTSNREKRFALILSAGGKKGGILVDRLIGQQELVIKAVDAEYCRSELVAGASILGNGRVVLILDVPSIFRKVIENEKKRMVSI